MKRAGLLAAALAFGLCAVAAGAPPASGGWEFLSTTDIGAKAFIDAHPEWDGRGVLIAVCDSGVDLGLPGLQKTSDGKAKILDARVFCDEGKISLSEAEVSSDAHGTAWHGKGGKWLYGLDKLAVKPAKGEKVLVGYFKEADFKNSEAEGGDLNGNGNRDDVYGLVVFKAGDGKGAQWTAYLDTNGDGNLADEKPMGDFSETHRSFQLRGRDVHAQAKVMTFALNLWPDEKEAALYMADGAHGTHVSGICAGYEIDGQKGYNGVAPGAQILALKIGNNTLSGGATTPGSMIEAWRYAVKKARELDMPLVIQMSYGVGSEVEGQAVAEKLIDGLLDENPDVVATVSAGNEGPGVSTVGMPAGARNVLSVAAVLNRASARDLYGVSLSQDEIFSFSDRGAELDKPNIAAPGFSASTVPNYSKGRNVFRGTSMASPQAAGGCALLLSAAKAQGLSVSRDLVTAAVERGASAIPGYGHVDQGWGLMSVPKAWSVLNALAGRSRDIPVRFSFETESPEMRTHKGPAIFWRGDFYPRHKPQSVTVKPVFPEDMSADAKARFYEAFDLESTAAWVRVDKGSTFMKAGTPAVIPVTFDAKRLREPGLYQARILGYAKGLGRGGREKIGPEWAIPVAVVVPETLEAAGGYKASARIESLRAAKVRRMFVQAGPGVSGFTVKARMDDAPDAVVVAWLFDPQGRETAFGVMRSGSLEFETTVPAHRMEPGVWEVDFYGYYTNQAQVSLRATVTGFPLVRPARRIVQVSDAQGRTPSATVHLVSALADSFRGRAAGEVTGSISSRDVELTKAVWTRTFRLAPGESGVTFRLSMSPEDYGLFTDVAVQVLDGEGTALASDGMTYRSLVTRFGPRQGAKSGQDYTLKVTAATADPGANPAWTLHVDEIHEYANPIPVTVTLGGGRRIVLYPDHEGTLDLSLDAVPPALPEGAYWLADLSLSDSTNEALKLPLELWLGGK